MSKNNYNFSKLQKSYIDHGFYIFDIVDKSQINYLKNSILDYSKKILKIKNFDFNNAHKYISKSNLN